MGNHSSKPSRRREGRHRVFRRPRHERGAALDAAARARSRTPTPRTSASPTSPTTTRSRARRSQYGAEKARLIDCRRQLVAEGHRGAAVRRVPHLDGRRALLQHDADRPRRHRHDARRRDEGRRRPHLGRRQHVQGQRHRALLSLRPARQSRTCASTSRGSIRRSSTSSAAARRCRSTCGEAGPRLQDERREGVLDRLEHARRDARSEGSRAAQHGHQDRRADHGRARSGATTSRSTPETVTVRFEEGQPVALNGATFADRGRS